MKLDFKDLRDADFLDTYSKTLKKYGFRAAFLNRDDILSEVITSKAKRFYVSEEQAMRIVSRMIRGEFVPFRNMLKKEMYVEILRRVRAELKNKKNTLSDAIFNVVNSEAPRFYINIKSARILYYHLLKKK